MTGARQIVNKNFWNNRHRVNHLGYKLEIRAQK
jgi:hypothetical protein